MNYLITGGAGYIGSCVSQFLIDKGHRVIFIDKLSNKEDLTFEESKAAFEILMNGKASEDEMFNFLTFLSSKGEVSDEIAGGVYVLRSKSKRVSVKNCVDTCGTGGDGKIL